eukprot:gene25791-biopygen18027
MRCHPSHAHRPGHWVTVIPSPLIPLFRSLSPGRRTYCEGRSASRLPTYLDEDLQGMQGVPPILTRREHPRLGGSIGAQPTGGTVTGSGRASAAVVSPHGRRDYLLSPFLCWKGRPIWRGNPSPPRRYLRENGGYICSGMGWCPTIRRHGCKQKPRGGVCVTRPLSGRASAPVCLSSLGFRPCVSSPPPVARPLPGRNHCRGRRDATPNLE